MDIPTSQSNSIIAKQQRDIALAVPLNCAKGDNGQ
jgi:hypothetical protein